MAKKSNKVTVETLKREEAARKNIPTVEYQSVIAKEVENPIRVTFERGVAVLEEEKSAEITTWVCNCFKESFYDWINFDESLGAGTTVVYAAKHGVPDLNSWASGVLMHTSSVAIYAYQKGYTVSPGRRTCLLEGSFP